MVLNKAWGHKMYLFLFLMRLTPYLKYKYHIKFFLTNELKCLYLDLKKDENLQGCHHSHFHCTYDCGKIQNSEWSLGHQILNANSVLAIQEILYNIYIYIYNII